MEVLFKIIVVLCLSSVSFGARFLPGINIQSPIGLDLGVNNYDSQLSKSSSELDQCYCFPSTPHLGSIIHTLDASNESIERVVVYLYRIKGSVVLFIPNKNKQKWFPNLYFDDSEGDILSTVSSHLIVDVFDPNVFNKGQTVVIITPEIVEEAVTIHEDKTQMNQFDESINISYETNIPELISVDIEEDIAFNEDNVPFDYAWPIPSENEGVAISYPQESGIINIPNAEQFIVIPSQEPDVQAPAINQISPISSITPITSINPISPISSITPISSTISPTPSTIPPIPPISSTIPPISTISPVPVSTISTISSTTSPISSTTSPISSTISPISSTLSPISINPVPIEIQVVDTIPSIEAATPVNIITPVSLDIQSTDQENSVFNNLDHVHLDLQTSNTDNLENIDINISNVEEYDGLQHVISITPTVSQSPIRQSLYPADTVTNYITFEKWFELQLKRVVLYNLESQSKIVELRERIKKILLNNGMQLDFNGIVKDLNGEIVKMSNIKLRPILIGAPSDPFAYVNSLESGVSFIQLLEIISSAPVKLLGTLVVGTVYLPRNIGQIANAGINTQNVDTQGCITCNQNLPFPSPNGLRYPPSPYANYDGLPFRRAFGKPSSTPQGRNIAYDTHGVVVPKTQGVQEDGKSGLSSVLNELLGNLGIAPILINPTRRLLAGGPEGPKAGPQSYPNDDLPGFRIVGGNAATSSGPPLANKGRSGLVRPQE